MVPEAPAARLSGLPVVLVKPWITMPVLFAVGGLGLETTVVCAILELFLTVIRNWKLDPEVIAETGLPRVSVIWNVVMARDFRVHKPKLLALINLLFV